MQARTHLVGMVSAILVMTGASQTAHAEPLRVIYAIWVGYGPLFVAQEKGFFADQGVEVALINFDDQRAAYAELFAGQVDAVASAMDEAVSFAEPDEDTLVCVLALDDSVGADGVVAHNDIRTIADLRGKVVAFAAQGVGQFYLNVLLKDAGLSEADLEVVDLPGQDAANAFLLQEIDAAVTWEPWLTEAASAEHGHLLTDSSERPGLIADCLVTTADVFEARKGEFQAVARAWDRAVAFVEAHPDEAIGIMAQKVGGWLEDPATFAATLEGIRFYDDARNREYFGTPDTPGQVYDTVQKAIDVWSSLGRLKTDLTPADVIRHGIWDE